MCFQRGFLMPVCVLALLAAGCTAPSPVSPEDPASAGNPAGGAPVIEWKNPHPTDTASVALYPCQNMDGDWNAGYIDREGNAAIEPLFADAGFFCDGLAMVALRKDEAGYPHEYAYINEKGENAFGETYIAAYSFSEGLAVVQTQLAGSHTSFVGGKAVTETQEEEWYIIDTQGSRIAPLPGYPERPGRFSEGLLCVNVTPREDRFNTAWPYLQTYAYFDREGREVFRGEYRQAGSFREGLAAVILEDGRLAYLNRRGEVVFDRNSDNRGYVNHDFYEGLAVACSYDEIKRRDRYGFIDQSGAVVIPLEYLNARPFSEGLAAVRTDEGVGFINHAGEMVIPPRFYDAGSFSEGVACVTLDGSNPWRVGFIDLEGNLIIDYLYCSYSILAEGPEVVLPNNMKINGLIQVMSFDEKWRGYIDGQGNVIYRNR